MLDETDRLILKRLEEDGRALWKDIGEEVHMTGQGVAARVRRMEDLGVIEGYTVRIDRKRLGQSVTALITVFMKTLDHEGFQGFLASHPLVAEAHRISGDGCYWVKAHGASQEEIGQLLDGILKYGNYRLQLSIGKIK